MNFKPGLAGPMIENLSERIWSHDAFHTELAELQERTLRNRYIAEADHDIISEDVLTRLLQCAATLSASKSAPYREAAYRIVTAASELVGKELQGVPYVMLLALSRMGNFPALNYAKLRYEITEESLPIRELGESTLRREGNSVRFGDTISVLTDFQFGLWDKLNSFDTLGISAPTSAGKSYVLQAYARSQLAKGVAKNIVFLVPTRALINQVSEEVSVWIKQSLDEIELITTPVPKDANLPDRAVFVVTQERLQLLQSSHESLSFELMLVDEAQSIADGPRGVLLSSVIEHALDRNPKMQLLFAGPNLHEPGKLSQLFGRAPNSISTDEAAVVQNIIFVDCDKERPNAADLSFRIDDKRKPLGKIFCDQPLVDHRSKLVNVALRMGAGGQNLIYALGPAECEKIAFGLADTEEDMVYHDQYLMDLSTFIKEAVHPKYQLASNVLNNVGYHYGRLPSLVRKSIEEAFALGHLKYLVTTSTLLHGVNMPAQNLFLHQPQKGQGDPIPPQDFWNLAGRAGRLGKEFSGNIFLIDYAGWENDPMAGPKDREIVPAIEQHVVQKIDQLISYIDNPDIIPDRNKSDELENTFVKLVRDHFDGSLNRTLDRLGLDKSDPKRLALEDSIERSVDGISITRDVLSMSPTVSSHRQQSLYEWIDRSLKKKGPAYVIPKHPRDKGAYHSYLACIKRCHGAVLKYPKSDKSHSYYAQMCKRWMMGEPLPMMIDASFNFKLSQGANPNIANVIRTTLSEIENDLRFKYVRLFSCYNAVLEQVLRDNGMADLLPSIPSIPMYLELGACSSTMISFMGLGLSRYTAGKLQSLPRRSDMSQAEARNWIRRQDISALDLPTASVREISRMALNR